MSCAGLVRNPEEGIAGGDTFFAGIPLRTKCFRIAPTQHKTRHYGHARYIPIRENETKLLGDIRKAGYVFLNQRGKPYTRDTYRQEIVRAIKRSGANHWTPLQLRHNAATRWFHKAGYDTASVLLGHKDRRSTARYIDQQLHDVLAASKKVA